MEMWLYQDQCGCHGGVLQDQRPGGSDGRRLQLPDPGAGARRFADLGLPRVAIWWRSFLWGLVWLYAPGKDSYWNLKKSNQKDSSKL